MNELKTKDIEQKCPYCKLVFVRSIRINNKPCYDDPNYRKQVETYVKHLMKHHEDQRIDNWFKKIIRGSKH